MFTLNTFIYRPDNSFESIYLVTLFIDIMITGVILTRLGLL